MPAHAAHLPSQNCNYACDVAKKLKMKVVGIGGKDIAEGSIKLTLAVVWQVHVRSLLPCSRVPPRPNAHPNAHPDASPSCGS